MISAICSASKRFPFPERAKHAPDDPCLIEMRTCRRKMAVIPISKQIHQIFPDLHDHRTILIRYTEPLDDRPFFAVVRRPFRSP